MKIKYQLKKTKVYFKKRIIIFYKKIYRINNYILIFKKTINHYKINKIETNLKIKIYLIKYLKIKYKFY